MTDETFVAPVMVHQLSRECILISDPRDGSSVWDELGQRTVARLIIRLCINTGKHTDHPRWFVSQDDSSCGWLIRLLARIYTQTEYQTSYRSLPKLVPNG